MSHDNVDMYWSMTEGVFNCLIDKKRTISFRKAIQNTVKKGDVVVDLGTGSGVLAMFSVLAGAKHVYAVEFEKMNIQTLKQTFEANGMSDKITILEDDARTIVLPEKPDVVVAEMVATGFVEELQVLVMNNILKQSKNDVKVLLNKYSVFLDVVFQNDKFYGLNFPIVKYEYPELKELHSISYTKKELVKEIELSKINNDFLVEKTIDFIIKSNGKINAIRLSGKTFFHDGSTMGATFAYDYPIILPVENHAVKKGDKFRASISYELNGGFSKLKFSFTKL